MSSFSTALWESISVSPLCVFREQFDHFLVEISPLLNINSTCFSPDFAGGNDGFTFKVSDSKEKSLAATGQPTSPNPNQQLPVADAGPAQTVFVRDVIILDGSASKDSAGKTEAHGAQLIYQWKQINGTAIKFVPGTLNTANPKLKKHIRGYGNCDNRQAGVTVVAD